MTSLEIFWEHILTWGLEMLPNELLETIWEHFLARASEMLPNDLLETIWAHILAWGQKCLQNVSGDLLGAYSDLGFRNASK